MPISQDKLKQMADQIPALSTDPRAIRQRVEALELILERSIRIPGINFNVGLDAVVGLIPVVGDIITAGMGAYMIWEARNLGLSKWQLMRMAANVGVDTLLGAVPFFGDTFDFLWRSNSKNLAILKKHLDKHHPSTRIIDI